MRALYFVRCWASVVAKSKLHNEISQNIFPLTPHGNGNIGWPSSQLLEFGFTVGEISPPPDATVNYWQNTDQRKKSHF